LSPGQVIDIIRSAKTTLLSQIKDIKSEISDAETTLSVLPSGTDVLNEEGLPIRDIREDVFDEQEGNRAVLSEEQPTKVYTMEEIDRMMDAAMEEEETELGSKESVDVQKTDESAREGLDAQVENVQKEELPEPRQKDKAEPVQQVSQENERVTKLAPDGLSVGYVNGEELIAKLVDDSKKRYNPMDDTWLEESDHEETDNYSEGDDDDDEEEEEEDQYGRTRGYLIPPNLSRPASTNPPNPIVKEKAVKFASFEKPATPSATPIDKPIKSALKKSNYTPQSPENTAVPASSSSMSSVMTTDIVERNTKFNVLHSIPHLTVGYPQERYQGKTQDQSFQNS
jgi:hypothetical protein